jgi:hypothetical protein
MAIQVTKRPYAECFSGNPVHYELYSAAAVSDATIFFEIRVKFKYVGGAYAIVLDALPYYPTAGYAGIDIKDILHSQLNYGLVPLTGAANSSYIAPEQSGYFYIEFREITTSNSNPSWITTESDFERFVVKGGLNYFVYRGNNFWINYFTNPYPFFTWQKNGRLAAKDEKIWLLFLNYSFSALKIFMKVYWTDGTNHQTTAILDFLSIGKLHYIPAGCDQWSLDANPAKKVHYWTIQIFDIMNPGAPVAASQLFTFYADNRVDYNDTTLHYRNSLGGLDAVRIRGVIEENLDYAYTEQAATITPDYFSGEHVMAQRTISDNAEQITYKGDIGYLGKEEQDRLRDAFIRREVYWHKNNKWWPVIITTKNNRLRSSTDTRWTMPIEWQLAYDGGEYYTPQSVDLGDGIFNDNVCLARAGDLAVAVDMSGAQAAVTATFTEIDPQVASTQVRYRVVKVVDESVVVNWTSVPYAAINFNIDKEFLYRIEVQSICADEVYGVVSSAQFSAITGSSGGTGTGTSRLVNALPFATDFNIIVNSVIVISGHVGAYGTFYFTNPTTGSVQVQLELADMSPSTAEFTTNGATVNGTITGLTTTEIDFGIVDTDASWIFNLT